MIGCYVTGILPRPKELIEATRGYIQSRTTKETLKKAFEDATSKVVDAQLSDRFDYVTDGMLEWQDMLRPFATGIEGMKTGSLARWFNNNTFYREPVIVGEIQRKKKIVEEITHIENLPSNVPWKAILPAPYTFTQLSHDVFYNNKIEFMFKYAEILREEITSLAKIGFKYVQLSDPALVYQPISKNLEKYALNDVGEALKVAVEGISVKTCLQTFFGDFSQILPEAIEFPVDHLGLDLYETDPEKLKEYSFKRGVALGLVDSRNSLIEKPDELVLVAEGIIESIYQSTIKEVFICPNCDLEFLPWKRAEEKMKVIGTVASYLRGQFS